MAKSMWDKFDTHRRHVERLCRKLEVADVYKAFKAVEKVIRERDELREYVDEVVRMTNTDNIGNALKRISSVSVGASVPKLPDALRRIPQIWLEGRAPTTKHPGVMKLTFRQAERSYRRLLPYLEEVWAFAESEDIELQEALKQQILEEYETTSADDMTKYCYAFSHNYELKEEEAEEIGVDKDPTMAELSKILQSVKVDYGVISKEQLTEEQP